MHWLWPHLDAWHRTCQALQLFCLQAVEISQIHQAPYHTVGLRDRHGSSTMGSKFRVQASPPPVFLTKVADVSQEVQLLDPLFFWSLLCDLHEGKTCLSFGRDPNILGKLLLMVRIGSLSCTTGQIRLAGSQVPVLSNTAIVFPLTSAIYLLDSTPSASLSISCPPILLARG